MTIFRSQSDILQSDRSAVDRKRHKQKIKEAISKNLPDIISEESIIGKSNDKIIKVPIKGVKEYRFIYGDPKGGGIGTGDGKSQSGQKIGQKGKSKGDSKANNEKGDDYYETEISLAELIDILFEELELPDLDRKKLTGKIITEKISKHKGYRKMGIRVRLDKKRTAIARIKRKLSSDKVVLDENGEERFPFHKDDLSYKHMVNDDKPQSNAVVFCVMDTSGSMDTNKKFLSRSFFFLLHRFLQTKYQNVEIVFVAHDSIAKEVNEEDFFHKGESGGTEISSGYNKTLEIIENRYHPSLWNIYVFHASDGDNYQEDNDKAVEALKKICDLANLMGYAEINQTNNSSGYYKPSSMLDVYKKVDKDNFCAVTIQSKNDIFDAFKKILKHDKLAIGS